MVTAGGYCKRPPNARRAAAAQSIAQTPPRRRVRAAVRLLSVCLCAAPALARAASPVVHHELDVTLHPAAHTVDIRDTLTLPPGLPAPLRLALHAGLSPRADGAALQALGPAAGLPGGLQAYALAPPPDRRVTLHYGGEIYQPLTQAPGEERQMRGTSGIVSTEGVYLDAASGWYPYIDGARETFTLTVHLPPGWDAVSQGGPGDAPAGTSVWRCDRPQDDIFLVAAPFTRYRREDGAVTLLAYLRERDPDLAARYLQAAGDYIARYARLIGPYPYPKFALVENFWQSGYGMPSFTLLGSEIIRFPFIIYTSFPHEILHNWWGNGVFVDSRSGNWSEGLTAYLSDFMSQAQRGRGADYRRDTLQKYADFAAAARDFPLTEFTSRNSQASEAVGYGKGLMLFHMLRLQMGDADFVKLLRRFYRDYRFRYAGFDDIRDEAGRVTGRDWTPFFNQWVRRTGAPALRLVDARAAAGGRKVSLTLEQTQGGAPYRLEVPVAVTLENRPRALERRITVDQRRVTVTLPVPATPLRVDVDPRFDVFRRLQPGEVPPALSGLFGADSLLIVLPHAAPAPLLKAYRDMAGAWQSSPAFNVTVVMDSDLKALPQDGAVWLFGWENRFRGRAEAALKRYPDVDVGGDGIVVAGHRLPAAGMTLVAAARRAAGKGTLGWLAAGEPAALPGLGRKLPHYTKYGYLIFRGAAPDNVARGSWPVLDSPMTATLVPREVAGARLSPRPPLLKLIPRRLLRGGG